MKKYSIPFATIFFLLPIFLQPAAVNAEPSGSAPLKKQQLKGKRIKNDIIDHVRQHNCEILDHESLARQLEIPQSTLFEALMELEREERIKSTMKKFRKPILLTHSDKTNYFWKVCLVSEQ